jgi:inner membrane protein
VEPITHALASLALARALQGRLPRRGTAMLLVAGVAADLDYLSYFAGPAAFLKLHCALLHSLPGSAVLIGAIAAGFCFWDRRSAGNNTGSSPDAAGRLRLRPALIACAAGAGVHLLLDCCGVDTAQLLWPFRVGHWAWDLATNLDPWILILLVAGLLLPLLFRLVSEEIGERKKRYVGRGGATVTLILLAAYLCARGMLHTHAVDLLLSRTYHARSPVAAGAFPAAASPLVWRGVVSTDNTIEDAEISLAPGGDFDPDRSATRYKPEDSAALEAGERAAAAKLFLRYAQIPLASVYRREEIYRFEIHDARFPAGDASGQDIFVRVDLNSDLTIREQGFFSAASPNP